MVILGGEGAITCHRSEPHWHFQEAQTGTLDVVAHGATHFTGNASHRERQDEEEADNNEASEQAVSK